MTSDLIEKIEHLIKRRSKHNIDVILANLEIGSIVYEFTKEKGEHAVNEIAISLNRNGFSVNEGFLFDACRVFRTLKNKNMVYGLSKKLGGRLTWGFLVNHCTAAPEGDTEEAVIYWENKLKKIEMAIEEAEGLNDNINTLPSSVQPQAEGLLYAIGEPRVNQNMSDYLSGEDRFRVAHIADIHLDELNRFEDTLRCLDFSIEDAASNRVSLFLVTGDIYDKKSSPRERNEASKGIVRMADIAPVVIIYGTPSHDYPGDLDIFGRLKGKYPVYVFNRPDVLDLGILRIFALPYPRKENLIEKSSVGVLNGDVADRFKKILLGFSDKVIKDRPSIFMAHMSITGAMAENGQVMIGRDLEIDPWSLLDLGMTYYAFGHIHRRQAMSEKIHYPGSINHMDFGESEEKGYNLVQFSKTDGEWKAEVIYRNAPVRKMVTVDVDLVDGEWKFQTEPADLDSAEVRVRYKVREEDIPAVNLDDLKSKFGGVYLLKIERVVIPTSRVRSEEIRNSLTLKEKLEAYWKSADEPGEKTKEECLSILSEIEEKGPEMFLSDKGGID